MEKYLDCATRQLYYYFIDLQRTNQAQPLRGGAKGEIQEIGELLTEIQESKACKEHEIMYNDVYGYNDGIVMGDRNR